MGSHSHSHQRASDLDSSWIDPEKESRLHKALLAILLPLTFLGVFTIFTSWPGGNLQIDKGILTIQYDHKAKIETSTDKIIRHEFGPKSFKRSFSLDEKINAGSIDAALENGVLTLTLPLKEDVSIPKKLINIK